MAKAAAVAPATMGKAGKAELKATGATADEVPSRTPNGCVFSGDLWSSKAGEVEKSSPRGALGPKLGGNVDDSAAKLGAVEAKAAKAANDKLEVTPSPGTSSDESKSAARTLNGVMVLKNDQGKKKNTPNVAHTHPVTRQQQQQ